MPSRPQLDHWSVFISLSALYVPFSVTFLVTALAHGHKLIECLSGIRLSDKAAASHSDKGNGHTSTAVYTRRKAMDVSLLALWPQPYLLTAASPMSMWDIRE